MGSQEYNPTELLICLASRLMEDGTTAFIGTGIPMLAASLAQKMHAPHSIPIFEFGGMGALLERLPLAVGGGAHLLQGGCGLGDLRHRGDGPAGLHRVRVPGRGAE